MILCDRNSANKFPAIVTWASVAPAIANMSPSKYSCLTGLFASRVRYSFGLSLGDWAYMAIARDRITIDMHLVRCSYVIAIILNELDTRHFRVPWSSQSKHKIFVPRRMQKSLCTLLGYRRFTSHRRACLVALQSWAYPRSPRRGLHLQSHRSH